MKRERTIWIAAGLLGLVVAVALAVLASHVSRPPVGLSGEPVSAGQQLAPARRGATTATGTTTRPTRTATTGAPTTRTAPPPPQAPRHSDDGGRVGDGASSDDRSGRGSGGDGDGDDD